MGLENYVNAAVERDAMTAEQATSPTTTLVVDSGGVIIRARNGVLLKRLGYSWPSDVEGQNVHIFLPEERRQWHDGMFAEFMQNPMRDSIDIGGGRLIRATSADGKQHLSVSVVVVKRYERDGSAYGIDGEFKGAFVHVTAIGQLEDRGKTAP